ncbi:hypothetical protein TGRUB_321685 [Toxoplasma gondii RUB]|uniref:Uncharacterized protein n=1 Tax=Toxoplasma gondii RUB TaxID=935652 RepID=A0A086LUW8_TOXGO|nr:hypothetical protein TGRUB_321685 [Toxoplasma gondii RUB]
MRAGLPSSFRLCLFIETRKRRRALLRLTLSCVAATRPLRLPAKGNNTCYLHLFPVVAVHGSSPVYIHICRILQVYAVVRFAGESYARNSQEGRKVANRFWLWSPDGWGRK